MEGVFPPSARARTTDVEMAGWKAVEVGVSDTAGVHDHVFCGEVGLRERTRSGGHEVSEVVDEGKREKEVNQAKAEQAEVHRLWPTRDRSTVSSYDEAVSQRNFWRGSLAAAAAVASIRCAVEDQAHFEEWVHRHALATQPAGTQLDWGSGAGWGHSRGNVHVRGWGEADSDGGWGTSTDWPFNPDLTTHIWSTTSYSNPGSSLLAWGAPSAGSWVIPKTPGKAKRRRQRKRRVREMEEEVAAARRRREDELRRFQSFNWTLEECS
ncbi:hypothetical protein R3P38DRAFT_2811349 [Favolaschia claudopus]|uniref:Uncharacterized protein n=1 Tax=Favolaschia claudopus TaxID=2862362 RepID=A0AAV9ZAQ2_9AGAR